MIASASSRSSPVGKLRWLGLTFALLAACGQTARDDVGVDAATGDSPPPVVDAPSDDGSAVIDAGFIDANDGGLADSGEADADAEETDDASDALDAPDEDALADASGDSAQPDVAVCAPGEQINCYDGPAGTLYVGLCHGGTRTCAADGSGFGACEGEVTPVPENCDTPDDDDCDGVLNTDDPGCVCVPGNHYPCWGVPPPLANVGACHAGIATCTAQGLVGPCVDPGMPQPEDCDGTLTDEDCDGQVNEEGPNCLCNPNGPPLACYSGPPSTEGVGVCVGGGQACDVTGLFWSPACTGERVPELENCAYPEDENCDGVAAPKCVTAAWLKSIAGSISLHLAQLSNGDIIVAGSSSDASIALGGSALAGGPNNDIVVARWTSSGDHVWSRRFPGASDDVLTDVTAGPGDHVVIAARCTDVVDFDTFHITCDHQGDALVVELGPGGDVVWAAAFGDNPDQSATAVATDSTGSIYFGGYYVGTLDFGGSALSTSARALYVAKFKAGQHVWSRSIPLNPSGAGSAALESMTTLSDDSLVIAGNAFPYVDLGGGQLVTSGFNMPFVARYDATGALEWARSGTLSSQGWAVGLHVVRDGADRIDVSGNYWGTISMGGTTLTSSSSESTFLIQLDTQGNHQWSHPLGFARALATNGVRVAATGYRTFGPNGLGMGMPSDPSLNLFAAELDDTGTPLWGRAFHAYMATAVVIDSQNDATVAGIVQNSADFGDGLSLKSFTPTVFVVHYTP